MAFALAEADALALYNSGKRSELARETNKIISAEHSANTPIVQSLVSNSVKNKLKNDIANSYHAYW